MTRPILAIAGRRCFVVGRIHHRHWHAWWLVLPRTRGLCRAGAIYAHWSEQDSGRPRMQPRPQEDANVARQP